MSRSLGVLTQERLKELLDYNPATGEFVWKVTANNNGAKAGTIAGSVRKNGYRQIAIDRRLYLAHRLTWFYVHGKWPVYTIDHIDRDRLNNRISNLRDVPHIVNMGNRGVSSVQYIGVSASRSGRFRASIKIDGKTVYLGTFGTPEEAHEAFKSAHRNFHGSNSEYCKEAA